MFNCLMNVESIFMKIKLFYLVFVAGVLLYVIGCKSNNDGSESSIETQRIPTSSSLAQVKVPQNSSTTMATPATTTPT